LAIIPIYSRPNMHERIFELGVIKSGGRPQNRLKVLFLDPRILGVGV